jgi:hypothetical protein
MNLKVNQEMVKAIEIATRKACADLFSKYQENFYYCSLITDGGAHSPILSAWSYEALERESSKEKDPEEAKYYLKWSYADSPYFAYGEEFFDEVKEIFNKRPMPSDNDDEYMAEYQIRLNSMEKAMDNLDKEGIFGVGDKRTKIVINAEVMPPDYTNTERALRLNPKEALTEWLEEIAEEE